jgi:hypothetical protein
MTTPLSTWICDYCHDEITDPTFALLAWQSPARGQAHDFRILHKGQKCDRDRSDNTLELHQVVGSGGMGPLLALLSQGRFFGPSSPAGAVNLDEWVDVFRRVQVPWYEEARQHFSNSAVRGEFADSNEVYVYEQESLKRIIEIGEAS